MSLLKPHPVSVGVAPPVYKTDSSTPPWSPAWTIKIVHKLSLFVKDEIIRVIASSSSSRTWTSIFLPWHDTNLAWLLQNLSQPQSSSPNSINSCMWKYRSALNNHESSSIPLNTTFQPFWTYFDRFHFHHSFHLSLFIWALQAAQGIALFLPPFYFPHWNLPLSLKHLVSFMLQLPWKQDWPRSFKYHPTSISIFLPEYSIISDLELKKRFLQSLETSKYLHRFQQSLGRSHLTFLQTVFVPFFQAFPRWKL